MPYLWRQEMGIYQHDSLSRLVNSIGKKLVSRLKDNPFEFKFFLADTPEPNAFALPGGYIICHTRYSPAHSN